MKIEVRNLNKSYGTQKVLQNCNLDVDGPGITCLMGPSGSGKTTLLRVMMGLEKADSGTVSGVPAKEIGAVFQEDRLLEEQDAITNVHLAAPHSTREVIQQHFAEVKLTNYEGKAVAQLSGGMRRRIAIVRAVMAENRMIFMDEPLKGLDETTKLAVMEYIRAHTTDRTVFIVTHEESEAAWFGGKIIRL